MLKHPFRMYALSLAGGALLLGGATIAAGAMTFPGSLPGGITEQSTAAIVTDGDAPAKVEQVYWRGGRGGWRGGGRGRGWGWRGRGWHRGWGGRGPGWCYWHPYACRGW
jgi:hypothetical protein